MNATPTRPAEFEPEPEPAPTARAAVHTVAVFVVLFAAAAALYLTPLHHALQNVRAAGAAVHRAGAWAPAAFVLAGALLIVAGLPRLLLTGIGGFAFGFLPGLVWSLLATLLGQAAVFGLVRRGVAAAFLARTRRLAPAAARELLTRGGVSAVVLVRQVPLHGAALNLLLAVSPVRTRDYLLGSAIGLAPQAIPAALIGNAAGHPSFAGSALSLLAAVASAVAVWISLRAYRRRHPGETGPAPAGEEPAAGRRPSWAAVAAIVALALLAAGALGVAGHAALLPRRFRTVESGTLYRSAWPGPTALRYALNRYAIRTVVNLCAAGDPPHPASDPEEARICRERGVTFLNLEIPPDTPPTPEQQAAWLALLRDPARHPVLVHCEHGVVRTGMMVAMFQVAFQGLTGEEAWRRLPQFGHDFMKPERDDVRDFVRRYSPPPPPPSDR